MNEKIVRGFLPIFGVLAFSCLGASTAMIVEKAEPSTVVVVPYDEEGIIRGEGSGFFISSTGDVITNRHVIEGAYGADIKAADGKIFRVIYVLAEDKNGDLIRLSMKKGSASITPLSLATTAQVGDSIVVAGSSLSEDYFTGRKLNVLSGVVTANRYIPGFGKIIEISASISPGFSGSPILGTDGRVIGVASFSVIGEETRNFAIPVERIRNLKPSKRQTIAQWEKERSNNEISTSEDLHAQGLRFLWAADYEKALEFFQNAVNMSPLHVISYQFIGFCNLELGNWHEAVTAFNQAVGVSSDESHLYSGLGLAYSGLKQYRKAIEAYRKALELDSADSRSFYNMGLAYAELDNHEKAVQYYLQAIRFEPTLARAHHNLGVSYGELNRWEEAIQALRQAVRIAPDDADIHFNLGLAYLEVENFSYAIASLQQAGILDPQLTASYFALGMAYVKTENWDEALTYLKIGLQQDPTYIDAYYTMGAAYMEMGKYSKAIEAYKKVLEYDPTVAEAHYSLGNVYIRVGDYSKAISYFKGAVTYNPSLAHAHFGIGYAYTELKKWDEAISAFREVVRIEPENASAHYSLGLLYLIDGNRSAALAEQAALKKLDTEMAAELLESILE